MSHNAGSAPLVAATEKIHQPPAAPAELVVAIVSPCDEVDSLRRCDVVASLGIASWTFGRRRQPVKGVNFAPGEVSGVSSAHIATLPESILTATDICSLFVLIISE